MVAEPSIVSSFRIGVNDTYSCTHMTRRSRRISCIACCSGCRSGCSRTRYCVDAQTQSHQSHVQHGTSPIVHFFPLPILRAAARLPLPPLVHLPAVEATLCARKKGFDDLHALFLGVGLGVLKVTAAQPRLLAPNLDWRDALLLPPDVAVSERVFAPDAVFVTGSAVGRCGVGGWGWCGLVVRVRGSGCRLRVHDACARQGNGGAWLRA